MPFRLDLVRHGDALPAGSGRDAERSLSEDGRQALERLATLLAAQDGRPGRVFASPLKRAQQSARVLIRHLSPDLAIEVLDELSPDGRPPSVLEALAHRGVAAGHVLMVSHQPLLGSLAAYLTAAPERGFRPGALCRVEWDGAPAQGAGRVALELSPR